MQASRHSLYFKIAFTGLILVTLFWTVFAILSGVQQAGGGTMGFIRNSPNAVPWLIALAVLTLARRFPVAMGLAFVCLALLTFFQFETYRHILAFAMITLPFAVFGVLMAWSGRFLKS